MLKSWLRVLFFIVYIMGSIGGVCYLFIERLKLPEGQAGWAIGGSLAVLLIPTVLLLFLQDGQAGGARSESSEAYQRRRQEAIRRRLAELQGRPEAEKFLRFVEQGFSISDAQIAERNLRFAQIEAVPHRRTYIEHVLLGGTMTDEQMDYVELADRLVLCEHLRGVEVAAKLERLLQMMGPMHVQGSFILNEPLLRQRFSLPDSVTVTYSPVSSYRDYDDYYTITCTLCGSRIVTTEQGPRWPAEAHEVKT